MTVSRPDRIPPELWDWLQPWVRELQGHPQGCITLMIEAREGESWTRCGCGFLDETERKAVRKALQAVNKKRAAAGQPTLDQKPKEPPP